jgi:Tol biopolymer transport system component
MTLHPGLRLGSYEITGAIGAGGMGEVYRGRDAALNRDVAIKVLPAAMASDADGLARFKREAQVLASLNHPNIAHVHGFEAATLEGGSTVHFLAMEMVEGEDLAERLRRGAIPVDEAIALAKQIAEGLEEAHERGIIHRDLKPANVKVTPDGKVKVLDFGLAKALDRSPSESGAAARAELAEASHSPTMSRHMTEAGMIMGTAAYMSPEQARGKAVDKRADIWAFGVVLFEMLTGRRLFTGETVSDTLAAVLREDVPWTRLPPETPGRLLRLLQRCLDRDPRRRLRDIGDARMMLEADETESAPSPAPASAPRGRSARAPWLVAALALVAAVFAILAGVRNQGSPASVPVRLLVQSPDGREAAEPVMSHDGSFLVYVTDRLYVRDLASFESRELPGTTGASQPFLSPDGKWVGFYADGKIKKIGLAGGQPLVLTDAAPNSPGAAFVGNDRLLFTRTWNQSALMSVPADGGAVTPVSTLDLAAGERGHWWPRPLPDGRHVLFTIWYSDAGLSASRVAVLDLRTGTHRVLFPGAMAQFADGRLLYYRSGQYHLVSFDPSSFAVTSDSRSVLMDALGLDQMGSSVDPVSVAPNGTIAYSSGEQDPVQTLTWMDRSGRRTPTALKFAILAGGSEAVALSPDERRIAVSRPQDGLSHIWVYDLDGGEQRLPGKGSSWGPIWSRDGRRIAFTSLRKGDFDVVTLTLDGAEETTVATDADDQALDWLADGRLVIKRWLPDGATSFLLFSPGGAETVPLVTVASRSESGRVSPDTRWLAFCASPSGRTFLYARALSGVGGLQQLAPAGTGDCGVRWSAAAKEVFFVRGTNVVAVTYDDRGERLVAARETMVAAVPPGTGLYAVTRDGQRVLVGIPDAPAGTPPGLRVVVGGVGALARSAGKPASSP